MPPPRRSTGGARARPGPEKGQSTISFASRVSKPVTRDVKKALIADPVAKSPIPVSVKPTEDENDTKAKVEEKKPHEIDTPEEEDVDENDEDAEEEEVPQPLPEKSDAEIRAEKITDSQVNKYWRDVEQQRVAGRVHQEGLTVAEKVLRYFDMSSQYGPCIGSTRLKRWQRAERLGLEPPIEVLAVLLREENKGNAKVERAHIDELLGAPPAIDP